jgi:hypothetical protein
MLCQYIFYVLNVGNTEHNSHTMLPKSVPTYLDDKRWVMDGMCLIWQLSCNVATQNQEEEMDSRC